MTRADSVATAHARLRRLIVRGTLAPGSELSQVELARRVGVSTTPLREALRRLEAEGLVDARHNHRPRVRPFDVVELDSIYAARILLECLGLRLAVASMTAAQLAGVRASLETMAGARSACGAVTARWEDAHEAFHQGLVAGVAAPLKAQIDGLMARGDRYVRLGIRWDRPSTLAAVEAEHAAIGAACEAGDAPRAADLLGAHLEHSARTIASYLAPGAPLPAVTAASRTTYAR